MHGSALSTSCDSCLVSRPPKRVAHLHLQYSNTRIFAEPEFQATNTKVSFIPGLAATQLTRERAHVLVRDFPRICPVLSVLCQVRSESRVGTEKPRLSFWFDGTFYFTSALHMCALLACLLRLFLRAGRLSSTRRIRCSAKYCAENQV